MDVNVIFVKIVKKRYSEVVNIAKQNIVRPAAVISRKVIIV